MCPPCPKLSNQLPLADHHAQAPNNLVTKVPLSPQPVAESAPLLYLPPPTLPPRAGLSARQRRMVAVCTQPMSIPKTWVNWWMVMLRQIKSSEHLNNWLPIRDQYHREITLQQASERYWQQQSLRVTRIAQKRQAWVPLCQTLADVAASIGVGAVLLYTAPSLGLALTVGGLVASVGGLVALQQKSVLAGLQVASLTLMLGSAVVGCGATLIPSVAAWLGPTRVLFCNQIAFASAVGYSLGSVVKYLLGFVQQRTTLKAEQYQLRGKLSHIRLQRSSEAAQQVREVTSQVLPMRQKIYRSLQDVLRRMAATMRIFN